MIDYARHAYARFRMRYPIYFFHHLPKCGGTSVREALDQWFHVNDDYFDEPNAVDSKSIELAGLNSHNCISGHFGHEGYFIHQRYPLIFDGFRAAQRYRVFTFLREPLDMRCSLHRHQLKTGKNIHPDLASSIMTYPNFYARILNVNHDNWQQRIDQYFYLGLADNLQDSFDHLAELIKKPKLLLPVSNSSERNHASSEESLSSAEIAAFKLSNALDYKIFDYVKSKFA